MNCERTPGPHLGEPAGPGDLATIPRWVRASDAPLAVLAELELCLARMAR